MLYSFWYGRVSLWKSYWLIGELLNALVILAIINLEIYIFCRNWILAYHAIVRIGWPLSCLNPALAGAFSCRILDKHCVPTCCLLCSFY